MRTVGEFFLLLFEDLALIPAGNFPTLFVLAFHDLVRPRSYPPADLTNSVFLPVAQGGYGLQLQRYVWEQYKSPFPPTDIAKCN